MYPCSCPSAPLQCKEEVSGAATALGGMHEACWEPGCAGYHRQFSCAVWNLRSHFLSCAQGRLAGLTAEFNSTAQSANRLLGSLMGNRGRGGATSNSPMPPETLEGLAQEVSEAPRQASRRSDMPPSLQKRSNFPSSSQTARVQQENLTAEDQADGSSRAQAESPRRALRGAQEQPQPSRAEPDPPRPAKRKLSRKALEKHEAAPESSQGDFSTALPQQTVYTLL